MKYLYQFLILVFVVEICNAQNQISIEIDSIHCSNNRCYFLNFSTKNQHWCYIYAAEQSDNKREYILDCGDDKKTLKRINEPNVLDIKKIRDISEFKKWVKSLNLEEQNPNLINTSIKHYKSFDQNYGVLYSCKNDKYNKISVQDKEVFQIIPILVNSDYYIAGLRDFSFYDIDEFIFPTKDNTGLMTYYSKFLYSSDKNIEHDGLIHKEIFTDFYIREKKDKFYLTNASYPTPLINKEFTKIQIEFPYILAETRDAHFIFDRDLNDITPNRLQATYPYNESIQMITNNRLKWLDNLGNIQDSMPQLNYSYCPSELITKSKVIKRINGEFCEITTTRKLEYLKVNVFLDTIHFNLGDDYIELKYINNSTELNEQIDCESKVFCMNKYLYYFKTKNGNQGILERINEKTEEIDDIRNQTNVSWRIKNDQINKVRTEKEVSFRNEILFQGDFDEFHLKSYYEPIIFRKNDLYGAYPMMNNVKYKVISNLNGFLAEITFQDNTKGWIDIYGNEIMKNAN